MLDVFLVMLAGAIQSVPSEGGSSGAAPPTIATQEVPEALSSDGSSDMAAAATAVPVFPAPTESPSEASPVFLAPNDGSAGEASGQVAPIFLSPAPAPTDSVAPVFLAPQSGAGQASAPALQAEPQIPSGRFTTAVEVKPILAVTRANWVAVREFNGQDLLYVTHLWSWRCGLVEMRIGINGNPPEIWPLPPCHMDQPTPNMITESDGLPYRSFGRGQVALIEVHLTYDDLTSESFKFNRNGLPLQ
jgi:hypothetical protein